MPTLSLPAAETLSVLSPRVPRTTSVNTSISGSYSSRYDAALRPVSGSRGSHRSRSTRKILIQVLVGFALLFVEVDKALAKLIKRYALVDLLEWPRKPQRRTAGSRPLSLQHNVGPHDLDDFSDAIAARSKANNDRAMYFVCGSDCGEEGPSESSVSSSACAPNSSTRMILPSDVGSSCDPFR